MVTRTLIPTLLAGALGSATMLHGQTRPRITVEPHEALIDERVAVRIFGFRPDSEVTIVASARDASSRLWQSKTTYRLGKSGALDPGINQSLDTGMKPFWSMRMIPNSAAPDPVPPQFARPASGCFDVRLEAVAAGRVAASTSVRRCVTAPGVKVTEARENGLVGRLYEPASEGRRPAVLVLTGSNGGIPFHHASLLASRGYIALALAYFRIDPLPADLVEIPIEYFEKAVAWLKRRESVDASRVGVIGLSRGAELALLLPALHAGMFQAIVAIAPSPVVWEGAVRDPSIAGLASMKPNRSAWTFRGKPLPFLPKMVTAETQQLIARDGAADTVLFYRPALRQERALQQARIPLGNIMAPVLLVSSPADRIWPEDVMAPQVCAAIRRSGGSCEHLQYPDASHVILEPWMPVLYGSYPAARGRWENASFGGSAEGTARAAALSWPKIRRFFDERLGRARQSHE